LAEGGGVGVSVSAAVEKIGMDIEIYRARTDAAMDNGHRRVHQTVVWWKVQGINCVVSSGRSGGKTMPTSGAGHN